MARGTPGVEGSPKHRVVDTLFPDFSLGSFIPGDRFLDDIGRIMKLGRCEDPPRTT